MRLIEMYCEFTVQRGDRNRANSRKGIQHAPAALFIRLLLITPDTAK
jgi:hypothetical protein